MTFCPNCGREVQEANLFCPNCGHNLRQVTRPQTAAPGALDQDASTAKTLTLVAIILQLVFFVIGVFFLLLFIPFSVAAAVQRTMISNGTTIVFPPNSSTSTAIFPAFGFFTLIFGFSFIISIVWIILDYFLIYRNPESPDTVPKARTNSLALGILQLIFGGVIPGILLIVAYLKIGESMQNRARMP